MPAGKEIEDARGVANSVGVPFRVVNLVDHYREKVVDYLVSGCKSGITPNPDVHCNLEVKFGAFLDIAVESGFEALATGHYCRKRENSDGTHDIIEERTKTKISPTFLRYFDRNRYVEPCFP